MSKPPTVPAPGQTCFKLVPWVNPRVLPIFPVKVMKVAGGVVVYREGGLHGPEYTELVQDVIGKTIFLTRKSALLKSRLAIQCRILANKKELEMLNFKQSIVEAALGLKPSPSKE